MKLSDELSWRGFVNQTTYKDISAIDEEPITFYFGVDPSASSMTIGNLAAAMMVRHFIKHGHKAILLVGGATGLIGDPDGKAEERNLKSLDEIKHNKEAIAAQYRRIFDGIEIEIVDNYDWFKDMGYLEFLREVGKHVPMRQMLGRDFVQTRLSEEGAGISYAEFSYVLIQAYDFFYLNKNHQVSLQVCGSDQWGNSIAGVDLIRRMSGNEAHVWSTPLVINKATGKKFGKSEDGAVWLDEAQTSVYSFYQFWLNVDDAGVGEYLRFYTELNRNEIDQIMVEFHASPHERKAQKELAYEVTKIVHGEAKADSVVKATNVLFGGGEFSSLSADEQQMLGTELGVFTGSGDIAEDLVASGLASSKSEARKFIEAGAVSLNGEKIARLDADYKVGLNLLKRGKNSFVVIEVKGE